MNVNDTGGPAFPFEYHNQTSKYQDGFFGTGQLAPGASQQFSGMTMRDYFAAKALQGMMVDVHIPDCNYIAKTAYEMADAMLKAREA
jgi:hypothetical protein